MKLDLCDLERRCKDPILWRGAAVPPPIVIALIARIRELESEANNAASLLEAKSDLAARREWAKALRERAAKGAVLP